MAGGHYFDRNRISTGRIAAAQGRFADAARHHTHAAASAEALGFPGAAALHRANLGRVQREAGDPAAAETLRRAVADACNAVGRFSRNTSRSSMPSRKPMALIVT